jgi:hypothetical protein
VPDPRRVARPRPSEPLRQRDPDAPRVRDLPCWVTLDLRTGNLWAHWTADTVVPPAVAAGWSLRWPIAPVADGDALLRRLAPHAQVLLDHTEALPPEADGGLLLRGPAARALDAIARRCAATYAPAP